MAGEVDRAQAALDEFLGYETSEDLDDLFVPMTKDAQRMLSAIDELN